MGKQPHNEHELELALTRFAGSNLAAVECRDIMAGVILGQMLPPGTVVKGGSSIRLRLGPGNSRATVDFDVARSTDLDDYIKTLRSLLEVGWADFTGEVVIRRKHAPADVRPEYIMQPIDVKLSYRNHPWCTVRLEVSHNELGDAEEEDVRQLPQEVKKIFSALNLPEPQPIPLMTVPFQIAQKLHGVSQKGSSRVRDLIDLQLIVQNESIDIFLTADICRRLFKYRQMQTWPPVVQKAADWDGVYDAQRGMLPVLPSCDEAVSFINDLINSIENEIVT